MKYSRILSDKDISSEEMNKNLFAYQTTLNKIINYSIVKIQSIIISHKLPPLLPNERHNRMAKVKYNGMQSEK